MKKRAGALLLLLLSTSLWAYDPLKEETDSHDFLPEEDWQEGKVEIPPSFNREDLQSFSMDEQDGRFSYFIERASLKTGDDFVTRFILVIRSSRDVVNSSFEGLRCGHRLYRVYAYGDADQLTPLPGDEWQRVPRGGNADYRTRLYDDLICNLQTGQANPPAAVFKAMRDNGRVNTPFLAN